MLSAVLPPVTRDVETHDLGALARPGTRGAAAGPGEVAGGRGRRHSGHVAGRPAEGGASRRGPGAGRARVLSETALVRGERAPSVNRLRSRHGPAGLRAPRSASTGLESGGRSWTWVAGPAGDGGGGGPPEVPGNLSRRGAGGPESRAVRPT